jgi:hypothetical protein
MRRFDPPPPVGTGRQKWEARALTGAAGIPASTQAASVRTPAKCEFFRSLVGSGAEAPRIEIRRPFL